MRHSRGTRRRRFHDTLETLVFLGTVALLWRASRGCPLPFRVSKDADSGVSAPVQRPIRLTFLSSDVLRDQNIDASDVFGEPFHPGTLRMPNPLESLRPPASDTLPKLEELEPVPPPTEKSVPQTTEP